MSGAYVAVTDIIPPIVYPPLWNPDWIFPGPPPPGWAPVYGMFLSADSAVSVAEPVTHAVSLTSFDVGGVGGPPADAAVFSATIDGSPRQLKLTSGGDFDSSAISVYASDSGMYNATPSLTFALTEADEGKTIVLTAGGSPWGDPLSRTANIHIKRNPPEILVAPTEGLITTPSGGTAVFGVMLSTKPKAPVVIPLIHSTKTNEGMVNKSSLTFVADRVPQIVTITGQDDGTDHLVPVPYAIILSNAISKDKHYRGKKPSNVLVVNEKNDIWRIEIEILFLTASSGYDPTQTAIPYASSEATIGDNIAFGVVDVAIVSYDGSSDPAGGYVFGTDYDLVGISLLRQSKLVDGTEYFCTLDSLIQPGVSGASTSMAFRIQVYEGDSVEFTHEDTFVLSAGGGGSDAELRYAIGVIMHNNNLTINNY